MSSQHPKLLDAAKHCEQKIADLQLHDEGEVISLGAHDQHSGNTKKSARIEAGEAQGRLECVWEKTQKESDCVWEKTWKESVPVGLPVAKEEINKSADEDELTVDHRCVTEPNGKLEVNVDMPSAVAVDSEGKEPQGKGTVKAIAGRIVQSVKNIFSGFIHSKNATVTDAKCDVP